MSEALPSWDLHPGQLAVWESSARFKVVATGRRWGKTYLAACWLIDGMLMTEANGRDLDGFDGYYIAPTFSQAKDIMFRLVERLGEPWIKKAWPSSLTFEFVTGRALQLKGADRPDRLRGVGLHRACLDEYASMRPEVWPYVVLPTMADLAPDSEALFIGSPAGRNHFYALYQSALSGRPGWEAWTFRTIDSPLIPDDEIESARETMTPHAFRQEFEADFGDAADCPLNPDLVRTEEQKPFDYRDDVVIGARLQTFDRELQDRWDPTRVDMSTFIVARMDGDKVHILDIERGRFSVREMCTRLLALDRKYRPMLFALESKQHKFIEAHLEERELRYGRALYIEPAVEPERDYVDRATWIVQPLLESKRLTFEPIDSLEQLKGQMGTFPDDGADDDMIRALAYACEHVQQRASRESALWEPLDLAVGI